MDELHGGSEYQLQRRLQTSIAEIVFGIYLGYCEIAMPIMSLTLVYDGVPKFFFLFKQINYQHLKPSDCSSGDALSSNLSSSDIREMNRS